MQVVSDEVKAELMATGVWFDHPNKAKEMRDYHEKQIRQQPRKRRSDGEHSPLKARSRA